MQHLVLTPTPTLPDMTAADRQTLQAPVVQPVEGRLGVLTVGMGAVASTLIAGVELTKRGMGEPIGSLTQMGTIRSASAPTTASR